MSDDGTYILRQNGRDRFFYIRHGASYLDRELLRGPEPFCAWVAQQRPSPAPFLRPWLAGLAVVDLDAQVLWFWLSQACASTAAEHALVGRLLGEVWRGWAVRWMVQPALRLAALLPDHPPEESLLPPAPLPLDAFSASQHDTWEAEAGALAHLRGEVSEAVMRSWVEEDTHRGAACVVTPGGIREVMFADGWDGDALLRAGPSALAALRSLPSAPLESVADDRRIQSAYWIDPAARTLARWAARPAWSGVPERAAGWEEWAITALPGGPAALLRRLGREPRALLCASDGGRLRRMLGRLLGAADRGWPWAWVLAEAILAEPAFLPLDASGLLGDGVLHEGFEGDAL